MSVYVLDANIISYYIKENKQVIRNIEKEIYTNGLRVRITKKTC